MNPSARILAAPRLCAMQVDVDELGMLGGS
jgi:hypothetical protein